MNRNQKLAVLRLFNKALLEEKPCGDYYINELLKMGVVCKPYYIRPNSRYVRGTEELTLCQYLRPPDITPDNNCSKIFTIKKL